MKATIYHNPRCGTSRNTLEMMREAGVEPKVVEYLKEPPTRTRLKQLLAAAGVSVRGAMRTKEPIYVELGLADPKLSDDKLLDAMVDNPILIERPIVETAKGVRLCRPADLVREIL
jgi:arsenate reductase